MRGGEVGDMMRVEQEVIRDLRHSIGNHFHKIYYWTDRIDSERDADELSSLVEGLNGALQRFQELLELGFRYFEEDLAEISEMLVADVASATASVLRTELPETEVSVELDEQVGGRKVRLDPQRFSLALRLMVALLGGTKRASFGCRLRASPEGDDLEVTIEGMGGEAPLETPVMEWAIARKTIAMQGGVLRPTSSQEGVIGGCVVRLPLGN